jgi:outer membrane lipoprotein SlyB
METTAKTRLHPLLTAAAVSVTVFSAVGVGAMTGVLPTSFGSSKEAAQFESVTSTVQAQPAAPVAQAPQAAPVMPAAPAASPAPKVVKKQVVQHASAPRSSEPVSYRDYSEAPRVAQAPVYAPPPPTVEAPKPFIGTLGVVESVREVKQAGEHTAMGPIAGGIAGAVLGNQFGNGTGKKIMTVVGAAGGAFAGREIEKQARGTKSWEINVRLDDGSYRSMSSSTQPFWNAGDRVRLVDGKLQPV